MAFIILVASVSVAVMIFGNGLRLAGLADDYTQAIAVAENRLAELHVAETLVPGESGGAAADMVWNVRIAPGFVGAAGTESKPDFFRVAVTVIWDGRDAPRSLTLHTLLIQRARQPAEENEETPETPDSENGGTDDASDGDDAGPDGTDEH